MNFYNRVKLHRQSVRNPTSLFHKFMQENSWKDFFFGTVYESTNYLTDFKTKFPLYRLSEGEIKILSHFTHLETRTLEQSLITKFSPKLNAFEKDVTFTYRSWDPISLSLPFNTKNTNALSVEVRLKGEKEVFMEYPSVQKTADGLGVSRQLVTRYLNNKLSIRSPLFDIEVMVQRPNAVLTNRPIVHPSVKERPQVDYDLGTLPMGYLYALNKETQKLDYSFKTIVSANNALNPTAAELKGDKVLDSKYISRYINLDKEVKTELGTFYFVANPKFLPILRTSKSKIPWVINLQTGEAQKFESATAALKHYKFSGQKTISNNLDKNSYIVNKYQVVSNEKLLTLYPDITGNNHSFSPPLSVAIENYLELTHTDLVNVM